MIGERVKHERLMQGLTQRELSEAADMTPGAFNSIENRNSDVYLSSAIKLRSALGFKSVEQLFEPVTNDERELLKIKREKYASAKKAAQRERRLATRRRWDALNRARKREINENGYE